MTDAERLALKPGDRVVYRDDAGNEVQATVRSVPWQLGHGGWVFLMKGMSGGYDLNRVVRKVAWANEEAAQEAVCVPNGYGLCSTHPVCDYMRATVREYQDEVVSNRRAEGEAGRLRAGLEMLAQVRAVCGNAQAAFRHNLRLTDAILAGADVRDLATVEAIAAGTWSRPMAPDRP